MASTPVAWKAQSVTARVTRSATTTPTPVVPRSVARSCRFSSNRTLLTQDEKPGFGRVFLGAHLRHSRLTTRLQIRAITGAPPAGRARGRPRPDRQRRDRVLDREPRPDGRPHGRLGHGRAPDDAAGRGVPGAA